VLAVRTAPCAGGGGTCTTATVRLDAGPDSGRSVDAEVPAGPGAPQVRVGESVVVTFAPDATPRRYEISDHQRGIQLWILVLAFAAAVVAFGRLRGLTALVGLGVTFAILLLFIVPAILDGRSPLLVAVVGSAAIMLAVLYLTHGFTTATSVAAMGVLISLTLTGVLAAVATSATYLTGVASDETVYVSVSYGNVDMRGLLLAGILIGSLGVLDDIAVTQAATVEELAAANPSLTAIQLYRAATRIGRTHIASVVNTIILAYAGAALPLLLLISAGSRPLDQILTNQAIAQEIIRSIVGTLGLIAAVPVTTMLAATLAARGVLTGRAATGRHR
jgi:uncharacterized membrane protein